MTTGLTTLDKAVQKAVVWTRELASDLEWDDLDRCWSGMRAVLHALRDRLIPFESVQLCAQLPMVIRGMYLEGWDSSKSPTLEKTKEEFLTRVAERLVDQPPTIDIEKLTRAVFTLLTRRITDGEIADVRDMLPTALRELWPPTAPAPATKPVPPELEIATERAESGIVEKGRRRSGAGRAEARRIRTVIRHAVAKSRVRGVPVDLRPRRAGRHPRK